MIYGLRFGWKKMGKKMQAGRRQKKVRSFCFVEEDARRVYQHFQVACLTAVSERR